MATGNVELVRSLHPAPDVDLAAIYRDDKRWAAAAAILAPAVAPDFMCLAQGYLDAEGERHVGLDGLRRLWLQWLAPWKTYRAEIEDAIEFGDDVLVLVRDFGRDAREAREVAMASAAVWTLRAGKVSRITFCADRATALKLVAER